MRKGLALAEILVVLIIVGILAAIIIPRLTDTKKTSASTQAPPPTTIKLEDGIWEVHGMKYIEDGRDFPKRYTVFCNRYGDNFTLLPTNFLPLLTDQGTTTNWQSGFWVIQTTTQPAEK